MPDALLGALFHDAKLLAETMEIAFGADDSFSGGRWIRQPCKDPEEAGRLRTTLKAAMDELTRQPT